MFDPFAAAPRHREDFITIPRVWVTFALSLILHAVALWLIVPQLPVLGEGTEQAKADDRLQVQIVAQAPSTPPPAAPSPPTSPAPPRETRAILAARPRTRNAPTPGSTW